MKIRKFTLKKQREQLVEMPEISEIMDIQAQPDGNNVMWALVDPDSALIDVNIKMYGTGHEVNSIDMVDVYIATVQNESDVWHFFMNYEQ